MTKVRVSRLMFYCRLQRNTDNNNKTSLLTNVSWALTGVLQPKEKYLFRELEKRCFSLCFIFNLLEEQHKLPNNLAYNDINLNAN